MDVIGRIEAKRPQIEALDNIQRFDHGRSLRVETWFVNLVAAILGRDRLFGLELECGHIFVSQQAIVGAHKRVDAMRYFTAIEVVAYGVDGGGAASARGQRLFLGGSHGTQRPRQVGLTEDLARHGHAPIRKKRFLGIRPEIEEAARAGDGTGALLIDSYAIRELNGRFNHLVEGFGSDSWSSTSPASTMLGTSAGESRPPVSRLSIRRARA